MEEGVTRHMGALFQGRCGLCSLIRVTHPVGLCFFRILKLHIFAKAHRGGNQIRIKFEDAIVLITFTWHKYRLTGLAFFWHPAMPKVIIDKPGRPAHIANGSARRWRSRYARQNIIALREVKSRVEQNGLHTGR
ncbi:hypothetical protein D9M70_581590 [compost metagenome]